MAILAALSLGGSVAIGIFSETVLIIGDAGSQFSELTAEYSLLLWAVLLVVHAPLSEEAMCRWPLAHRPRTFLLLPGIYIAVAGITGYLDPDLHVRVGLLIDLAVVVVGLGLHLLSGRISFLAAIDRRADRLWLRWPALPVWILISCFGLAHLARFDIEWSGTTIPAIPFVVLPWLWFGALVSIARIRFGWWTAVALHAAINFVVLLLDLVFGLLTLL